MKVSDYIYGREEIDEYVEYYENLIGDKRIPNYYATYLNHILNHKRMVYLAWIYIGDRLCELGFITEEDQDKIHENIINHDNSKLLRDEFPPYGKRLNGRKGQDPEIKQRFKDAVKLHKQRNLHHYEALKSYKGEDWKHYAVELICDYIAMGWEFHNYICEYFETVKDEIKASLPEEYYDYIESIIKIIPREFSIAEKDLTEYWVQYITFLYNYYNDPFEENESERNRSTKKD